MKNLLVNVHTVRVRYADTDKMGIVYNGMYLVYFEVGRTELMRSLGLPYTDFEREGFLLPLIESRAFYKNAAFYDNLLDIEATLDIEKLGATVTFDYNIFRGDTTIAKGYTIHSFIKNDTRKPVKPPEVFMKLIRDITNKS